MKTLNTTMYVQCILIWAPLHRFLESIIVALLMSPRRNFSRGLQRLFNIYSLSTFSTISHYVTYWWHKFVFTFMTLFCGNYIIFIYVYFLIKFTFTIVYIASMKADHFYVKKIKRMP